MVGWMWDVWGDVWWEEWSEVMGCSTSIREFLDNAMYVYQYLFPKGGFYLKCLYRVLIHHNVRSTCLMFVDMFVSTITIQQQQKTPNYDDNE